MEETKEMEIGGVWEPVPDPNGQSVDLKAVRKHFSRLGLMFLLGTTIIYASQLISVVIVRYLWPEWLSDSNISISVTMIPQYLVGMPLLILLVKRIPAVKVEQHHMKAGHFALTVIMCFAIMYASNLLGNAVTVIIGLLKNEAVENVALDLISSLNLFWLFLYTVICAPIMEEYIFRKLIVDRTVRYGQGVAMIMSGLVFGLFHGNLNQFMYTFTLGMFLAFLYAKTGKLKVTIAIHMMVNFMGGIAGALLLKLIDLDEYQQVFLSGNMDAIMNYTMENIFGIFMYFAFAFFVVGVMIAGGVLLIVFLAKKRFTLAPGEVVIPKGKRFRTVILNVGMILFSLFWIVMILSQLLL